MFRDEKEVMKYCIEQDVLDGVAITVNDGGSGKVGSSKKKNIEPLDEEIEEVDVSSGENEQEAEVDRHTLYRDWSALWPLLKQGGWTYVNAASNDLTRDHYYVTGKEIKRSSGVFGVNMFRDKKEVMKYCIEQDVLDGVAIAMEEDVKVSQPGSNGMSGGRKKAKDDVEKINDEVEEVLPDYTSKTIDLKAPWANIWYLLRQAGWKAVPGDLCHSYYYIMPSVKKKRNGVMGITMFRSSAEVCAAIRQLRAGKKVKVCRKSGVVPSPRRGGASVSAHEGRLEKSTRGDHKSESLGIKRKRGEAARSKMFGQDVEIMSSKRKRMAHHFESGKRIGSVKPSKTSVKTDNKTAPSSSSYNSGKSKVRGFANVHFHFPTKMPYKRRQIYLNWGELWPLLKQGGWNYVTGDLENDYFFVKEGVKKKDGVFGVNMFRDPEAVTKYCIENDVLKGVEIHYDDGVEELDDGTFLYQFPKNIPKSRQDVYSNWKALWPRLRKKGWSSEISGNSEHTRFYLLPGVTKATGILDFNMFRNEVDATKYAIEEDTLADIDLSVRKRPKTKPLAESKECVERLNLNGDWKDVWHWLKQGGWKQVPGDEKTTWFYVTPEFTNKAAGVFGEDMFRTKDEVVNHCKKIGMQGKELKIESTSALPKKLLPEAERRQRSAMKRLFLMKEKLQLDGQWRDLWEDLVSVGWKWVIGEGDYQYVYLSPGAALETGKFDVDIFASERDVIEHVRGGMWKLAEVALESLSANVEKAESAAAAAEKKIDHESANGRSAHNESKVTTVAEEKRNFANQKKEQYERKVKYYEDMYAAPTRSGSSVLDLNEPWPNIWFLLKQADPPWTYATGDSVNAFYYLAPGVLRKSDGILGINMFRDADSVIAYLKQTTGDDASCDIGLVELSVPFLTVDKSIQSAEHIDAGCVPSDIIVHANVDEPIAFVCERFRGHENAIRQLASLVSSPTEWAEPLILVHGGAATGKTLLVNDFFRVSGINYAYVDCMHIHRPRELFDSVLNQMRSTSYGGKDGDDGWESDIDEEGADLQVSEDQGNSLSNTAPASVGLNEDLTPEGDAVDKLARGRRCDTTTKFINQLSPLMHSEKSFYLLLDNAELLGTLGRSLLPGLARIQDLSGKNIGIVLITQSAWESFDDDAAGAIPVTVHIPINTPARIVELVCNECPLAPDVSLRRGFVHHIYSVFRSMVNNVRELRYVVQLFFPTFRTLVYLEILKDEHSKDLAEVGTHFEKHIEEAQTSLAAMKALEDRVAVDQLEKKINLLKAECKLRMKMVQERQHREYARMNANPSELQVAMERKSTTDVPQTHFIVVAQRRMQPAYRLAQQRLLLHDLTEDEIRAEIASSDESNSKSVSSSRAEIMSKEFTRREEQLMDSVELPMFTKFILIAAYLASHNPADTDMKLFTSARSGRRRNKRKSHAGDDRSAKDKLRRPRVFPAERMFAIFDSLITENMGSRAAAAAVTIDLHVQVTTLVRLNLLAQHSDPSHLDQMKFASNVDAEVVDVIAKTVKLDLPKYLQS